MAFFVMSNEWNLFKNFMELCCDSRVGGILNGKGTFEQRFPIAENKQGRHTLETTSEPFHRVSRDKILHDSWSISAALARGFSEPF